MIVSTLPAAGCCDCHRLKNKLCSNGATHSKINRCRKADNLFTDKAKPFFLALPKNEIRKNAFVKLADE